MAAVLYKLPAKRSASPVLKPVPPFKSAGPAGIYKVDVDRSRRIRDGLKVALLSVVMVTVVGAVGYFRITHGGGPQLDEDLCSVNTLPGTHVGVLLDPSDRLSAEQLTVIRQAIITYKDALAPGDRLSIWAIQPQDGQAMHEVFSSCKLRDGSDTDWRIENRDKIIGAYEQKFEAPLEAALKELAELGEADTSPILEAIHAVAATPAFSAAIEKRVLLIASDMLQNTPAVCSHFRKTCNFAKLERERSLYVTDAKGLAGTEVTVYQLKNKYQHHQNEAHAKFWQDYFHQAAGVKPKDYEVNRL